jgi:hypothetical protein
MLLQYTIYKVFSLIACKKKAFTPYLMFAEDVVQKVLFMRHSPVTGHCVLLLSFITLFASAGVYDTFLWYLDTPGFVMRQSLVNAETVTQQLLPQPAAVVLHTAAPGNVTALNDDAQLAAVFGGNLFRAGINFSLRGAVLERGKPQISVPALRYMADPNPRIRPHNADFSVSVDGSGDCQQRPAGRARVAWGCQFPNRHAAATLRDVSALSPRVHWGQAPGYRPRNSYEPSRPPHDSDSSWANTAALSGGGTVLMKQLFSVSKGRRRHTFVHTVVKATVRADFHNSSSSAVDERAAASSVADLLIRAWDPATVQANASYIAEAAQAAAYALAHNASFRQGAVVELGPTLQQDSVELLHVGARSTYVRVSSVNVTLVRSDTLPAPVEPVGPCSHYNQTLSLYGPSTVSGCQSVYSGDNGQGPTNHQFLGRVDMAAVFVLNGFLGSSDAANSTGALNADALAWLRKHGARLDDLLLARGYIAAVDPSLVTIAVSSARPGMSYLQLLLVALAGAVALLSYAIVSKFTTGHYKSSLLANLVATTADEQQPEQSQKPRYLRHVPDITLGHEGARIVMATDAGIYRLDQSTVGHIGASADADLELCTRNVKQSDKVADDMCTASVTTGDKKQFVVKETCGE